MRTLVSRDGFAAVPCHVCSERVILIRGFGWVHGGVGPYDHGPLPALDALPELGAIA